MVSFKNVLIFITVFISGQAFAWYINWGYYSSAPTHGANFATAIGLMGLISTVISGVIMSVEYAKENPDA